ILFPHPPPSALYTLSLHDALPISCAQRSLPPCARPWLGRNPLSWVRRPLPPAAAPPRRASSRRDRRTVRAAPRRPAWSGWTADRSEEHTSELQSRENLVCRLLLEK